jgi:opacity protein-like surface antigen
MKKILVLVSSTILLVNTLIAQDAADKNVRFGLRVSPTPTWLRSNDLKNIDNGGTKFGFGFGLQIEFKINSTASFVTGIGGDFLGGTQTYKTGQGYALTKDNSAYVDSKSLDFNKDAQAISSSTDKDYNYYELKSRSVKASYVTIPVLLKLMTKDISGFKYFGMFGGNIAVQTKYRATDNVSLLTYNDGTSSANPIKEYVSSNTTVAISDMRPTGDIFPINLALNVGLGAEYNISGSTSLFVSINYIRGFINQYTKTSSSMINDIKTKINNNGATGALVPSTQSALSDGVQINIGVLF